MPAWIQAILKLFAPAIPAVKLSIVKPEPIPTQNPTIPACGITLVKSLESCRLEAYLDPRNIPTIGYGHTLGVKLGDTCTQEQADMWLRSDLTWAWSAILAHVKVPLSQNQAGALLSFVFNLGEPQFLSSGVYKALQAQNYGAVPVLMKEWNKITVNGEKVVDQGLVNRRLKEANLFTGAA